MSAQAAVAAERTVEGKLEALARELDRMFLRLHGHTNFESSKRAQPATGVKTLAEGRHLDSTDVRRVYEHWLKVMGKRSNAKLTPERRRLIQQRLKQGYTVEFIVRAIDGCAASDFYMARGQHAGGARYNDLTLICRNGAKLEEFHDMAGPSSDEKRSAFL